MFTKVVAKRITNWLVQGGQVSESDSVIYEFGLDKLFSTFTNFSLALMFGLLFGIFWQTIVFYLSYTLLRIYAGGYHAEKPINCFFASIGVLIPCLVVIRFYQVWDVAAEMQNVLAKTVFYALLIISGVTLLAMGPVEHKNKRLDAQEKVVYEKRLHRNLIIVLSTAIFFSAASINRYAVAVLCGLILVTVTAVIGKIKLVREK